MPKRQSLYDAHSGAMKRAILVAVAVLALAFAGAAGAHGILRTFRLNPGSCRRVSGARICAKRELPRTRTVVQTVTTPPNTVTVTQTVEVPTPEPTPLQVGIEQVRREVVWADATGLYSHGADVAFAALDYTVGHVSTGAYGYLELTGGALPGFDANTILTGQAGICGQAAHVFAALVTAFGLPVQSVWMSYTDPNGTPDGHIAVEVYYDGGWHFFDPTFGAYWTDSSNNVLPFGAISSGTEHKDDASFTNVIEDQWAPYNDNWFETDPATVATVGTLTLP